MGMGSFLAVSRASNLGARLIHLTYSPGALNCRRATPDSKEIISICKDDM